jgi:hypothetical protein
MSLPLKAIDRLFERLAATYGAQWTRLWADVPVTDVKTAWAHELAGYASNLQALAWALENLPERCPNVIEFRNLCRRSPAPEVPRLPEAKADPERVQRELARLGDVRKQVLSSAVDHKAWAKALIARDAAGEKVRPYSLKLAQAAMRPHLEAEAA